MKCPNCGKEAIFVNGKYVCLDCGIEISPEQQAAQNMSDDQIIEPAISVTPFSEPAYGSPSPTPVEPTTIPEPVISPVSQPFVAEPTIPIPTSIPEPVMSAPEPVVSEPNLPAPVEPISTPEPVMAPASQPVSYEPTVAPETEKPVQQYYEDALSEADTSSNENQSGIYDFSVNTEKPVESVALEIAQPEPIAAVSPEPPISSLSPSEPVEGGAEAPIATEVETNQPESYFAPNSFDMKTSQPEELETTASSEPEVISAPMETLVSTTEPEVIAETPTETPTETPIEPEETLSPSEEAVTPELVIPAEGAAEPEEALVTTPEQIFDAPEQPIIGTEPKSLDEMLGSVSPDSAPIEGSPISAYGPDNPVYSEPTPMNITNEKSMPTVESVFGGSAVDADAPKSNLPTPQDFGVAPKPVQKKNKKIMPIIIAVIVSILLLAGVAVAAIFFLGDKGGAYPQVLNEGQVTSLSGTVSSAMQQPQGIAATYSMEADLSGLTLKEASGLSAAALPAAQKQLTENYNLTGSWYSDPDGDLTVDSSVGGINDKRTYISQNSSTYVYSVATQKFEKQSGLLLSGIPAFADAQEKTTLLYATNIVGASLVAREQLDGAECSKYELRVGGDIVKDVLSVMGGVFQDAEYLSLSPENLKVYAWVGVDNKLAKITFSGEIPLETKEVSGTVSINSEVSYKYLSVTIEDPSITAEATKNTEIPVSVTASANEEEGETSSVDNNTEIRPSELVVEIRG
jgi:hypothetical protein